MAVPHKSDVHPAGSRGLTRSPAAGKLLQGGVGLYGLALADWNRGRAQRGTAVERKCAMNGYAIRKQVENLVEDDMHIFAKHVLSWPESYAFMHKSVHDSKYYNRVSCARRKLTILKDKVADAFVARGDFNELHDVNLYYDAVRNWVCNCFLRGYLTWGKRWQCTPIDRTARGMMIAVDALTMSRESRLLECMVPRLLGRMEEEQIAEELGTDVEAVRQYRRRIYVAAKRKCLQDALAMEVINDRDERWVVGLFVAGWDEACIARELDREELEVTGILDKVYRTQSLSSIDTARLSEHRRKMVDLAVANVSLNGIADEIDENEETVDGTLNKLARRKALMDLGRRLSQLAGWRVILLRAVAGCDLADQDVADGDGVDPHEVLSTVAAVQSWVKTKYGDSKKRMKEACERGIVELQESWNVRSDEPQQQHCRLAAASLKWSDCEVVRDVASCGLSRLGEELSAIDSDSYAKWGNCRLFRCLWDHTLPVRNRLQVLQEVEDGVELNMEEYKAAALNFLIARLPGILWWWDLRPKGSNEISKAARKLEKEIGLDTAVDILKSLKNRHETATVATVARLATEGNSIATIAKRCDMTPPDVRSTLSLIASRYLERTKHGLAACWER